jgi:hypothetical protein
VTKLFDGEDWSNQTLHNINFENARVQEANLDGSSFSGYVGSMKVNGFVIWPLIEAELTRLHPEYPKLKVADVASCREALEIVLSQLDATFARARALPEAKRRERVDDEWSVIETVRHLVYVIDKWLTFIIEGGDDATDPIALPNTADAPIDPNADPSFDEAAAAWRDRRAHLEAYVGELSSDELERNVRYGIPALHGMNVIFSELWWHNRYMARDLEVLER